jgi:hypothetical protein
MVAYRRGQLAAGDCSPAAPTDPDVRVSSSGALGTALNKTVQKAGRRRRHGRQRARHLGVGQPSETCAPCRATMIVETSQSDKYATICGHK